MQLCLHHFSFYYGYPSWRDLYQTEKKKKKINLLSIKKQMQNQILKSQEKKPIHIFSLNLTD